MSGGGGIRLRLYVRSAEREKDAFRPHRSNRRRRWYYISSSSDSFQSDLVRYKSDGNITATAFRRQGSAIAKALHVALEHLYSVRSRKSNTFWEIFDSTQFRMRSKYRAPLRSGARGIGGRRSSSKGGRRRFKFAAPSLSGILPFPARREDTIRTTLVYNQRRRTDRSYLRQRHRTAQARESGIAPS
jgi:hypothetical protein